MRVLMVANTYLPVRNGVTVSMAGWIAGLRELGCEVDIWTIGGDAAAPEGVHSTPGFGQMAAGFPYPMSLRPPREIRERHYDIVHAHHPVVLGPPAARLARRLGVPLVATAHSDYLGYLHDYAPRATRAVAATAGAALLRDFFERCSVILAPSTAIERTLRGWGVRTPVERCVYPVDAAALAPVDRASARAAVRIPASTPLALYVGRVAAEKGLDDLVAEFEAAAELVPNALLAVAGGGPRAAHLRDAVEHLGLGDTVRLLGPLRPLELGLWYAAADVHVSASPSEVGPLTVIEAAVCATPSIGYRVAGFEDRIADGTTGLLAERVPGALACAMAELLTDRDRAAALGRAARDAAAENTPTAAAETLLTSYEGALATFRGHSPSKTPRT